MLSKRKLFTIFTAISIFAMLIAGSYAWTSFNSSIINSWKGSGSVSSGEGPGGTLHDDFCSGGENKDVYVENWGEYPLFVRVKLAEYMETGEGAGIKNDPDHNHAVSIDKDTGKLIDDISTWTPHASTMNDTDPSSPSGDLFHQYWKWTMGGQKYYFPASEDLRGKDVGENGKAYVDTSNPEILYPLDKNFDGVYAKQTLNAEVITMENWISLGQPMGNYWVIDSDGYAYWAAPLLPGEATGLLLDKVELIKNPSDDYYYGLSVSAQMATKDGLADDNYLVFLKDATDEGKALINKIVDAPVSRISIMSQYADDGEYIYAKPGEEVILYAYSDDGSNEVLWSQQTADGFNFSTIGNEAAIKIGYDTPSGSKLYLTAAYAENDSIFNSRILMVFDEETEIIIGNHRYIMYGDNTYFEDFGDGRYSYIYSAGMDLIPGTSDDLKNVVIINGVRYLALDEEGMFLTKGPDGKLGTADDVKIFLCLGTMPPISPKPTPPTTPTSRPSVTQGPTITITATPTDEPVLTRTPTPTGSPAVTVSVTPTGSPAVTVSVTPTGSPAVTVSVTPTGSPAVTVSVTPTGSPAVTVSATPTVSPAKTISPTPTNRPTFTITPTPSSGPVYTITFTPTKSPTFTPTPTASPVITNTPKPTISHTPTNTPTPTKTRTPTTTPWSPWLPTCTPVPYK